MGAYKTRLNLKPVCVDCSGRATHEVFNTHNAFCGNYCSIHADTRIEELAEHSSHFDTGDTDG